jgi:hypothetical protein
LWDVAPDGSSQTLVARGTYRPSGTGTEVWQLHANGWRFAAGHVPKLELLGADAPYTRVSTGAFSVSVGQLELRLPTHDAPGGQVQAKSRKHGSRMRHRKSTRRRAQPSFTG